MSLIHLPAELLDAIFEPLSDATLAAVARTSVDLYASACRRLYRHVSVSTYARSLAAVDTLATRSHLAALVRTFSISLDEGRDGVNEAYYASLYHALRGMQHLTELEVHVDANRSWVLFDDARSPAHTLYPSLETFSCSFPLDANVARFLEGTPTLHSLQVSASPDSANLARTAVPLLRTYTGPPCLLPQLLPSRPLTTLLLSGDLTLAHVEQLAACQGAPAGPCSHAGPEAAPPAAGDSPAAARIETLSAITSAPPVAVIEALTQACASLVCLRVITTCAFWETPDTVSAPSRYYPQIARPDEAISQSFYGRIANALASLPLLSAFELGGMHWEFRPKSVSSPDGICPEKEWVSPPVSPRSADDVNDQTLHDNDFDFDNAFMEWGY